MLKGASEHSQNCQRSKFFQQAALFCKAVSLLKKQQRPLLSVKISEKLVAAGIPSHGGFFSDPHPYIKIFENGLLSPFRPHCSHTAPSIAQLVERKTVK